jgi:hypothetical protein
MDSKSLGPIKSAQRQEFCYKRKKEKERKGVRRKDKLLA